MNVGKNAMNKALYFQIAEYYNSNNLNVTEACKMAGINTRKYYRICKLLNLPTITKTDNLNEPNMIGQIPINNNKTKKHNKSRKNINTNYDNITTSNSTTSRKSNKINDLFKNNIEVEKMKSRSELTEDEYLQASSKWDNYNSSSDRKNKRIEVEKIYNDQQNPSRESNSKISRGELLKKMAGYRENLNRDK
jgi:hypothetical protein